MPKFFNFFAIFRLQLLTKVHRPCRRAASKSIETNPPARDPTRPPKPLSSSSFKIQESEYRPEKQLVFISLMTVTPIGINSQSFIACATRLVKLALQTASIKTMLTMHICHHTLRKIYSLCSSIPLPGDGKLSNALHTLYTSMILSLISTIPYLTVPNPTLTLQPNVPAPLIARSKYPILVTITRWNDYHSSSVYEKDVLAMQLFFILAAI